jgi:TRAP-type C4-dicarboxylate transport system permease large subunit
MAEMGMITPPVAMNVFLLAGIARDVPITTIYRGITPYFIAMLACTAIIIIFPNIALFLPRMMKG